jgi:hypothetical protein
LSADKAALWVPKDAPATKRVANRKEEKNFMGLDLKGRYGATLAARS